MEATGLPIKAVRMRVIYTAMTLHIDFETAFTWGDVLTPPTVRRPGRRCQFTERAG